MTDPRLQAVIAEQPYPLLFVTISGAHLYGFPSPDSDYDLRGTHCLPASQVVGLLEREETVEFSEVRDGLEIDLVSHDIYKFFEMLLKRNGYVLEQLYSPLILHTTPEHDELKQIAVGCITKHHAHHYLGFAQNQWQMFYKESPRRVKPLLYVYRVLLTGIHLMQTGEIQANLVTLNEYFRLPYIPELIERKLNGTEKGTLDDANLQFHETEYSRLVSVLEATAEKTTLPDAPSSRLALNDLLVRLRLA